MSTDDLDRLMAERHRLAEDAQQRWRSFKEHLAAPETEGRRLAMQFIEKMRSSGVPAKQLKLFVQRRGILFTKHSEESLPYRGWPLGLYTVPNYDECTHLDRMGLVLTDDCRLFHNSARDDLRFVNRPSAETELPFSMLADGGMLAAAANRLIGG